MNIYEQIEAHCKKRKYSDELKQYWLRHPKCEIIDCDNLSGCPHHIKSRGAGGTDDSENLIAFCLNHHVEIEQIGIIRFMIKNPFVRDKIKMANKI